MIESDPPPLRVGRGGARAPRPVRRRVRAVGARARRHRARRPGHRGDRRRRGQHPDLPGGPREVRRRARWSPAATTRATSQHFELLGVKPAVSATDLILRLIEHEVPQVRAGAPARPARGAARDHRARGGRGLRGGRQARCSDLGLPEGSLVISILRDGGGFVPLGDSVVEAGDEVLLVLDTGLEDKVTERFASRVAARRLSRGRPRGRLPAGRRRARRGQLRALAARGGRRRHRSCSSGREDDPPYNRPPLSKGYLRGKESREDVALPARRVVERSRTSSC